MSSKPRLTDLEKLLKLQAREQRMKDKYAALVGTSMINSTDSFVSVLSTSTDTTNAATEYEEAEKISSAFGIFDEIAKAKKEDQLPNAPVSARGLSFKKIPTVYGAGAAAAAHSKRAKYKKKTKASPSEISYTPTQLIENANKYRYELECLSRRMMADGIVPVFLMGNVPDCYIPSNNSTIADEDQYRLVKPLGHGQYASKISRPDQEFQNLPDAVQLAIANLVDTLKKTYDVYGNNL